MSRGVFVDVFEVDGRLCVQTSPSRAWKREAPLHGGRWDAAEQVWTFPIELRPVVLAALDRVFHTVDGTDPSGENFAQGCGLDDEDWPIFHE